MPRWPEWTSLSRSGITAAASGNLRSRSYRGSSRRKKKQGLGLGLPLSRLLARANGGDLVLHATSEAGAVLRLSLPKPPAP